MIILDTNVLSALMSADQTVIAWLDRQPATSIWTTSITIFEVRFGLIIMPAGRRQALRAAEFERIIDEDLERRILWFDAAAAEQSAALMAARQQAGRPRDLRDTMIAGIAQAQRATVATNNVRHFDDLTVPFVDPWHD
ncbi:MAG TPA: type II toxin-antitoxin system VapC family toxin [Xanthobacteraceae bacterium]|jgi:predicted nucleic acid-binding protein|nr:type II toxin-antitoxin system VapC family toxin [Xanthobacteraceae bacterium]